MDDMKSVQVSFGHQRRRTKIGRLQSRRFTADAGLPFASTVPMKPRNFKLLLCEVDRERKRSQLVAIAFIPLADIMHKSEASGLAYLQNRLTWSRTAIVLLSPENPSVGRKMPQSRVGDKTSSGLRSPMKSWLHCCQMRRSIS